MLSGGQVRLIDRAFPFHFSVGSDGRIVDAGPRLREIAGDALADVDFHREDLVDGPLRIRDHAALRATNGEVNVVDLPPLGGIRLRGEFVADGEDEASPVRFLGHPWITSLADLDRLGLELHDFPPHTGLSDLLVNLQMREAVNRDLQRLAGDLRERTSRLEEELRNRDALEQRLQQAQRMEAVGRLAGGIAHDFNNALMAIGGHAALGSAARDLEAARSRFAIIAEAVRRAEEITARILAFARKGRMDIQSVPLAGALAEARAMLEPLLGDRVELHIESEPDASPAIVDPSALQQALVNLVINARDATRGEGVIDLRARSEHSDEVAALRFGDRPSGDWAVVEVSDHGIGMPPEVVDRIFEPFFTTKELGEGTGLGLSTVWWVVERSGGFLDVRSVEGRGTTVAVHLPAASEGAAPPDEKARSVGVDRRVLVVEDDPVALAALVAQLEGEGYRIESAHSAEEAIEIVDRSLEPFDILLTDVLLQEMSGPELASRLRIRQPWLSVVFVSGADRKTLEEAGLEGPVLAKPFTIDELRSALAVSPG